MIRVLTVHHRDDRWVDLQLDALARHMSEPYRVHAVLDGVSPDRFDLVLDVTASDHATRLDALAETVDDDDLIMFLDGDAFPIADPIPTVSAALDAGSTLVAVRRDEGSGAGWPHPSFCAVPAHTWRRIGGTWAVGTWPDPSVRHRRDVGVELLKILHGRHEWTPLLRTNTVDLHPLFFAVYGGLIYHHGAGFRVPVSSHDNRAPDRDARREANRRLGDEIHAAAVADPDFWRRFVCE